MTQKAIIRRHLQQGLKISPLHALRDYGCMRLADVIFKLRRDGMDIRREWRTQKGKRFAVYKLEPCSESEHRFATVQGVQVCQNCGHVPSHLSQRESA